MRRPPAATGRRQNRRTAMKALLTILLLAAGPAAAGGKFQLPEGCEAFVTVQHSDCQVSQHYTCEKDPAGDQWAVYAGPEGPFYMSRIDRETRWVESHDLVTPESDRLGTETDPASFSALLETGRDDFDFSTVSSNGVVQRYVGHDRLTGKTFEIDGVPFEQTEFALETFDDAGNFISRRRGEQMISRDWRLFFGDSENYEDANGDTAMTISRPMTFAFPGEAGFLARMPLFGCSEMMTEAPSLTPPSALVTRVSGVAP